MTILENAIDAAYTAIPSHHGIPSNYVTAIAMAAVRSVVSDIGDVLVDRTIPANRCVNAAMRIITDIETT